MSDNIFDIFKNTEGTFEDFQGFESFADQWMNLIGIEEGIRKAIDMAHNIPNMTLSPGDLIVFKTRLLLAIRYLRPALTVFDIPLPDTHFNIRISHHNSSSTTFSILLTPKMSLEPIILQVRVLQFGEWGELEPEEVEPCSFNDVVHDMIYSDLITIQDRMVTMGVAKKVVKGCRVGGLDYHQSAYTYLAKDLGFQVMLSVLGLNDKVRN